MNCIYLKVFINLRPFRFTLFFLPIFSTIRNEFIPRNSILLFFDNYSFYTFYVSKTQTTIYFLQVVDTIVVGTFPVCLRSSITTIWRQQQQCLQVYVRGCYAQSEVYPRANGFFFGQLSGGHVYLIKPCVQLFFVYLPSKWLS